MSELVTYTGEVVSAPTIAELQKDVNQEHHLVEVALGQALDHVIRAGEILSEIRDQFGPITGWEKWVEENFDGGRAVASYYMRIYEYRELVQGLPNVRQAMEKLRGMPAIRNRVTHRYDEETRETARALIATGMSYKEVSNILGATPATIKNWTDPEALKRHRARIKEDSRKRREARRQKKAEATRRKVERDAKRVGGALAEAYSLAYKLEAPLAIALREATDPEVKRLLEDAIYQQHRTLYRIISALGIS